MNIEKQIGSSAALLVMSLVLSLVMSLVAAPALAEDAVCKTVLDAMERTITTPNHAYITVTSGATAGKPSSSESINTGKTRYQQINGQWQLSRMTTEDVKELSDENRKDNKNTCRFERDETIDNTGASLYSVHSVSDVGVSDSKVWIAKSTGLPVHQIVDIDVGAGPAGKNHSEIRFVYTGIAAPPVVTQ